MRSYGQFCAAARALDVVGERWSLLIVRELLLRDCRFGDLRRGLPGIATNLLTERLRSLERAGVVERVDAPPPIGTTLYRLTPRGRDLEPVLRELVRWGMPEMARGTGADDVVDLRWGVGALPVMYEGADLTGLAPLVLGIEAGGEELTVTVDPDASALRVALGRPPEPAAVVRGAPDVVLSAFAGRPDALAAVEVDGDRRRVAELVARSTVALGS